MKVGVQLPEWERPVRWTEVADMAVRIEALGFDSIWVGDHLLYREHGEQPIGPWECWSQLAALAAITERVTIAPLVAATSFHAPAMLAKKAATVDEISNGRLILGLGAGWNRTEYTAFGFPYDHRVSRFEEAFTLIRRLLAGEEVTFRGEYYSVEDSVVHPLGPRDGAIPLLVGSNGPRMLEITLPHVNAWNTWFSSFDNRAANLPPLLERIDAACEAVGRNPADVEKSAALMLQFSRDLRLDRSDNPLRGSVDELAAELHACQELGIDEVQLVLDPITIDSVERAGEVLRAFRG
ncbi:MAG: LLM class flavin-dependent oxidoreductase [Acidimicrobiia bacterium]|jgi:probable F420-dependent oxidoreductase|nr:MAG: LLM class flavin-dependent oxidoreductase [Acidimicrobiia bacterium]